MSEEMNRHEAELNEAALEGVSGGDFADEMAREICAECQAQHNPCSGSESLMAQLIRHRSYGPSPQKCPYNGNR